MYGAIENFLSPKSSWSGKMRGRGGRILQNYSSLKKVVGGGGGWRGGKRGFSRIFPQMKLVWKRGWRLSSVKWRYVGIVGGSSFWGWFSSRFWLRFNDLVFWDWADVYLDDDAGDVLFCFFCLFLPGTATIIILIAMHFLYFPAKKKSCYEYHLLLTLLILNLWGGLERIPC